MNVSRGTLVLIGLAICSPAWASETPRDPFRPFVNPSAKDPVCTVTDTRPDIRSLKLVAVLSEGGRQHAVLEDAARLGITVTSGTELRSGQSVARIESDHLEVDERIRGTHSETRVVHERWLDPAAREPVCKKN